MISSSLDTKIRNVRTIPGTYTLVTKINNADHSSSSKRKMKQFTTQPNVPKIEASRDGCIKTKAAIWSAETKINLSSITTIPSTRIMNVARPGAQWKANGFTITSPETIPIIRNGKCMKWKRRRMKIWDGRRSRTLTCLQTWVSL